MHFTATSVPSRNLPKYTCRENVTDDSETNIDLQVACYHHIVLIVYYYYHCYEYYYKH